MEVVLEDECRDLGRVLRGQGFRGKGLPGSLWVAGAVDAEGNTLLHFAMLSHQRTLIETMLASGKFDLNRTYFLLSKNF